MRISDWSSDVCSSDLIRYARAVLDGDLGARGEGQGEGNAIRPIDVGEAGPLVKRGIEQRVAGENQIGEVAVDQVGRTRIGDQAVLEAAVGNMQPLGDRDGHEIGRASCRERVCQYV